MIRFKCIYCGQRVLAQEDGAGKKGECPKCKHLLVVPRTTKGRPAISPNKEPIPERPKPYVPAWDRDQPWMHHMTDEEADVLIKLCKESFGFLIPTYDKLSLFLMAVTLILSCVGSSEARSWIHRFLSQADDKRIFVLVLLLLAGLGLFLCRIFTRGEKTVFEKQFMMLFAVLTNIVIGFTSGLYVIKNSDVHNWQLVFPIWNIINGALLLLMLSFRIIDEECISDRDVTFVQIVLGLTAVIVIFILCNYVFKLHWVITFSICIVYTTSFDRALQSVFPGLANREDEEP
ncbi:MAG: hypothetical protein WAK60_01215, partial [Sedimentisphaerales bacterium]